jgi:site-specific recombinase XerD
MIPPIYIKPPCGILMYLAYASDFHRPYILIWSSDTLRPSGGGPLFGHFDRSPLTRYQFTSVMKKCLHTLGIEETQYASHSFRIGMATTCAMKGVSDDQIKMYGR